MESPFPGMDPYLEARWSDVHASLIFAIKDDIDYTRPLDPPLSKEDEAWANELLRKAGRR